MPTDDPILLIEQLFASEGAADYLGEAVTQAAHMLQAAALAEQAGATPALVAAALLHDVGHFTGTITGHDLMRGTDNRVDTARKFGSLGLVRICGAWLRINSFEIPISRLACRTPP